MDIDTHICPTCGAGRSVSQDQAVRDIMVEQLSSHYKDLLCFIPYGSSCWFKVIRSCSSDNKSLEIWVTFDDLDEISEMAETPVDPDIEVNPIDIPAEHFSLYDPNCFEKVYKMVCEYFGINYVNSPL